MLYPSFSRERCFSTTYMERGGHSGKDGRDEAIASSSLRQVRYLVITPRQGRGPH
jgi:hypothetical protein